MIFEDLASRCLTRGCFAQFPVKNSEHTWRLVEQMAGSDRSGPIVTPRAHTCAVGSAADRDPADGLGELSLGQMELGPGGMLQVLPGVWYSRNLGGKQASSRADWWMEQPTVCCGSFSRDVALLSRLVSRRVQLGKVYFAVLLLSRGHKGTLGAFKAPTQAMLVRCRKGRASWGGEAFLARRTSKGCVAPLPQGL